MLAHLCTDAPWYIGQGNGIYSSVRGNQHPGPAISPCSSLTLPNRRPAELLVRQYRRLLIQNAFTRLGIYNRSSSAFAENGFTGVWPTTVATIIDYSPRTGKIFGQQVIPH